MSDDTTAGVGGGRQLLPAVDGHCRGWPSPPAGNLGAAVNGLGAVCTGSHGPFSLSLVDRASNSGTDDSMVDADLLGMPSVASLGRGSSCSSCSAVVGTRGLEKAASPGAPGVIPAPTVGFSPGLLPPPSPSASFCLGSGNHGMAGVHKIPVCIPTVWGNAKVKNSATTGPSKGPMAANLQGSVPTSVWKRPPVFDLPILKESSSFSIDDNSIRLDDVALEDNLKRFEAALVGHLFGKRIPFVHLNTELHRRWEGFGSFRLVMVSSHSFVCFFENGAARDGVLAGGPWLLAGQVIGIDRWLPSFSPSSMEGYSTPVWVRLPSLPLCCWDKVNIARITSPLGQPLWIDAATNLLERGVFARACVKVDLSKPLKSGVWVHNSLGSFYQPIEYEGLPVICFFCGLVGHKGAECKTKKCQPVKEPIVNNSVQVDGSFNSLPCGRSDGPHRPLSPTPHLQPVTASPHVAEQKEDRGLGPWMLVQRKQSSRNAQPNGILDRSPPLRFQPAKPMRWVAVNNHVASSPNHCASRFGNISSQLNKTRPSPLSRSDESNSMQTGGASATSPVGSPPPLAPLSPTPPSHHPPLMEGAAVPNLEAGVNLHGRDAKVLTWDSSKMAVEKTETTLQVPDHAVLSVQQDFTAQPVFGGFTAMPLCSEGPNASPGAIRLGARQRRGARAGGKVDAAPLTVTFPCAQALVDGSFVLPMSTQCEDAALSSVQGLDDASSLLGAIVPYNNQDAIARMAGEGGKRKGALSLKVDKMLNDLGPISLSPRKRRMIVVHHDGGDASPSLPA